MCGLLQLAWTCYNFYQSTPTKLAGENYFFHSGEVRLLLKYITTKIVEMLTCAFDFGSGHVSGYVVEHPETRNRGITVLPVAPYRK